MTAIEYLIQEIKQDRYVSLKSTKEWNDVFRQSKEIEKEYLFNTLIDFVGFPHDYEEPRGVTIARFLEQLKQEINDL
jgi:phosphoribosylformylglycinamidine (FGAM) synthase PurS component